MKFELSRQIFEEYRNIKFHENPPGRATLFHVDRESDGQTSMTKVIVTFPNFAKVPKNIKIFRFMVQNT